MSEGNVQESTSRLHPIDALGNCTNKLSFIASDIGTKEQYSIKESFKRQTAERKLKAIRELTRSSVPWPVCVLLISEIVEA